MSVFYTENETMKKTEKMTPELLKSIIKKRNPNSHKGTYGHAMVVAGSYGKIGAAVLAAQACLRTGARLLTLYVPKCGYTVLQTAVPEAMLICDGHKNFISKTTALDKYMAVGIGCGIGTHAKTAKALKKIIHNSTKPMVIDADAINIIAENIDWLPMVPKNSIFTPHLKEFERLVGKSKNTKEQHKLQDAFAIKHQVYLILKGHRTRISCPDGKTYMNSTGNAGMAKAGNGDALTGMLTAFLAQSYSPEQACIAGVYMHGLAGDIASKVTGEQALLASDLIGAIGKAFLEITSTKKEV
jgi:NAD(P)H-hydrate epimerase